MSSVNRWPPTDLHKLEQSLDELADAVRTQPKDRSVDEHIWLTRFLVVRSCGYIEQVMYRCVVEHLEAKSSGTVRSYSLSWLERSINPSVGNILATLGRFDQSFVDEFERMLAENDNELHRELSVLVTKRHAIAHGENEGLGPQRTLQLYEIAKTTADWIIRTFRPNAVWESSFTR